ncbi:MAG: helix-turn-helix domain-containing protein [Micropepsaceae bacterium]
MFEQAQIVERVGTLRDAYDRSRESRTPASGRIKLNKHRIVFFAGDPVERFFEVESGAVMIYRMLDDGRRQLVEVVFAGGIVGLSAGEFHESSCETLTPSVLRSFKSSELAQSDALRTRVVKRLQIQLSSMHDHVVSLGRKTAEERVCTLIVRMCELEHSGANAADAIALPMSRSEIADYLGLTLETVCRTLNDLARRGFVEMGARKSEIKVPDLGRLRQAACCDA